MIFPQPIGMSVMKLLTAVFSFCSPDITGVRVVEEAAHIFAPYGNIVATMALGKMSKFRLWLWLHNEK